MHPKVSLGDVNADAPLSDFKVWQTLCEQAVNPSGTALPASSVSALVGDFRRFRARGGSRFDDLIFHSSVHFLGTDHHLVPRKKESGGIR